MGGRNVIRGFEYRGNVDSSKFQLAAVIRERLSSKRTPSVSLEKDSLLDRKREQERKKETNRSYVRIRWVQAIESGLAFLYNNLA